MKQNKLIYLFLVLILCGCTQSEENKDMEVIAKKDDQDVIVEKEKIKDGDNPKVKEKESKNEVSQESDVVDKKDTTQTKKETSKAVKEKVKEQPEEESKPIKKPPVETTTPPSQDNSVFEVPETPIVEEPVKQEAMAQAVMNQINAYRQQHGLQPLAQSSYHQQKANSHAYEMAKAKALWHQDNGECITNSPDPFSAWVSSPEHNEILLRENNTQGVVSIYYVDGYYYSVFKTSW